jgi:hypothetical protein
MVTLAMLGIWNNADQVLTTSEQKCVHAQCNAASLNA